MDIIADQKRMENDCRSIVQLDSIFPLVETGFVYGQVFLIGILPLILLQLFRLLINSRLKRKDVKLVSEFTCGVLQGFELF